MKKLLLLLLVLTGGVSTASADVRIKGDFCEWNTGDGVLLSGDKMRGRLDVSGDILFKLVDGSNWLGYSNIDFDAPAGVITQGSTDDNIKLNASVLGNGTYRFTGTYNSSTSRWSLKIEKGSLSSYTVHYVNGTGLSNVYVFTFNDAECGEWPGSIMTKSGTYSVNGESYDVYSYTFNALFTPENIVFTNNDGFQTSDLIFIDGKTYGYQTYSIVGEGGIFSSDWDSNGSLNFMKDNGDGTYTYNENYKELTAQTILLKVLKREGSLNTWQDDPNTELVISEDGIYNISITTNSDLSTVSAEATRVTVVASVGTYGMATLCSEYALDFTGVTDVRAYTITDNVKANGTLLKSQITGKVPAKTGLYIEGNVNASANIPTTIYTESAGTNMLVGVTSNTNISQTSGDYTNFILTVNTVNGEVGTPKFYKVNLADGNTVPAGKAYLQILTANAARESFWFDNEATAVEAVKQEQKFDGEAYNLAGQRIAQPTKGLYIVNGKKVIMK